MSVTSLHLFCTLPDLVLSPLPAVTDRVICLLTLLPCRYYSASDLALFLVVLDRRDHHPTQPDVRISAGSAAAALPGPLRARLGLPRASPPSSGAAAGGSSLMLPRHGWLGWSRARKMPSHPLTQKACSHWTLCWPEILGMMSNQQSLGLSDFLSKYLPVCHPQSSYHPVSHRPQAPAPLERQGQSGKTGRPNQRASPRAVSLPPPPRSPSCGLKP